MLYRLSISSPLVGSVYLLPSFGSNGAVTLSYPTSNIISLLFRLIMAWLLKAHSSPINIGYGLFSSTISLTLKYVTLHTPSIFTGNPVNMPIGTILYWFSNLNWIGDQTNLGFSIISHVFLGKTFTSDPKSNITLSMSYSPIYALKLNSPLVLFLHNSWFTNFFSIGVSFPCAQWMTI